MSEGDLSGTCGDVCSSAAELGHCKVQTAKTMEKKNLEILNLEEFTKPPLALL